MSDPTRPPTLSEAFDAATECSLRGDPTPRKYVMVLTGELDRQFLIQASLHRHVHPQSHRYANDTTTVDRERVDRLGKARTTSAFDVLIAGFEWKGQTALAEEMRRQKAFYQAL